MERLFDGGEFDDVRENYKRISEKCFGFGKMKL